MKSWYSNLPDSKKGQMIKKNKRMIKKQITCTIF